MPKTPARTPRREDSLSRERIVEVSIQLLDANGEAGLTFRALSERLATGPGAIYGHVANKSDLLTAACDAIVSRTLDAVPKGRSPREAIRAIALGMFDTIDAHPWVGSALSAAPGEMPVIRLMEHLGQPLRALGVAKKAQWSTVSVLLSYVVGVAVQNAANAQFAQATDTDRSTYLGAVAAAWSALDPDMYPFTRGVAGQLQEHDDRVDFLAGVDLFLRGVEATGALESVPTTASRRSPSRASR
ncbi:MAG: TetR/AcrR family transcriptional regulator [Luteibacter sp.]